MSPQTAIFLFVAGALGGALNAVAGGGSFIAFPALLFTGVPPIPANATNTIALWTAAAASGGAYRNKLDVPRRVMIPLFAASLVGGLFGALLLLKTPAGLEATKGESTRSNVICIPRLGGLHHRYDLAL